MTRAFIWMAVTVSVAIAPAAFATCGGGGGGGIGGLSSADAYVVPWRRTPPKDGAEGLQVLWFSKSDDEYLGSNLHHNRFLSLWAGHCVSFHGLSQNSPTAQKYATADGGTPVLVIIASDGTAVARIDQKDGPAKVKAVQQLLQAEVDKRRAALKDRIAAAETKYAAGNKDEAIAELNDVAKQKCMFPGVAEIATKKITELTGSGAGGGTSMVEPNYSDAMTLKMEKAMTTGLDAELHDRYSVALKDYEDAHKLDPADPTPLRYIGELYRHEIGDWEKAADVFKAILAEPTDPLSEAIALHGLGKMTIHNGQFEKGRKMMEQSLEVFPTAIACRNLAVYWNSEGDYEKSEKYINEAVKLDPSDRFNVVFAAVFAAGNGHTADALKIANENEDLMPASYNLAAIYAQSGNKEKALELLRRHFFEYERNESVRSKEMMEARVDRVFASLRHDKQFMDLTSGADGKLPMRD